MRIRQHLAGILCLATPAAWGETAHSLGVAYYTPTQDHREIDVAAVDFTLARRYGNYIEPQGKFSLFHSDGTRSDAPGGTDPNSTATGIAAGIGLRLYPITVDRIRPFIEGSAQFLYTPDHVIPAGGTGVNGFLRAGAGVSFAISQRVSFELTYQWYSHVSNAAGVATPNPMWNGHGGAISVRRRFP